MHAPQPVHLSGLTLRAGNFLTDFKSTQGLLVIITEGSSAASSSLTTALHALRSNGSTTLTLLIPIAFTRASRSILPAGSPLML